MTGYYRFPTVHQDRVVFVSEDDLWEVPLGGGRATRLTSGRGETSHPRFSPDGSQIAFTGTEEGATEAYVMPSFGGPITKLTHLGTMCAVVGWAPSDPASVLFRSSHGQPFARQYVLFQVPADGGEPRSVDLGIAHSIAYEPGGPGIVLARNSDDLARWKRYRGGTAAALWVDRAGDGQWERLCGDVTAGLVCPMWIGGRIYFVTDEEGYANLYSVTPSGEDRQRHTHHTGFYVRFASTDGRTIVYTVGGDLYRYDVASGEQARIDVEYASPRTQLNREFVDAERYLDDVALHPKGHSVAVTSRGKAFNFGLWEGATRRTGAEQGVRYRLPHYLDEGDEIILVSDEGGEEHLEIHRADGSASPRKLELGGLDIGRAIDSSLSPQGDKLALVNHRFEVVVVDIQNDQAKVVDCSEFGRIDSVRWAPDGRWITYPFAAGRRSSRVRIYDVANDEKHDVTTGEFLDFEPTFDPKGRYLYFVSHREFEPVYDQQIFDLGFPASMKPCVVTLQAEEPSPFFKEPKPLDGGDDKSDDEDKTDASEDDEESSEGDDASEAAKKSDDEKETVKPVEIDFDGIRRRVEVFPVPSGTYTDIAATAERVFWTEYPIQSARVWGATEEPTGHVRYFTLSDSSTKSFATGVHGFDLGPDGKTISLWGDGLRVVSASGDGVDGLDEDDGPPSRKNGLVDLGRLAVSVDRLAEWRQMLRESWRLMREHHWRADLSGVDWDEVWTRYEPLVDRVGSRAEFSDIVWTMQGEVGTSHAYEFGGHYRRPPQYRPGFLGAEVVWDAAASAHRVDRIYEGDPWNPERRSPLLRAGANIAVGDHIVSINGVALGEHESVQQHLVRQSGKEIELGVRRGDGDVRQVTVRALRNQTPAIYRDWVNNNRKIVHDATGGRVGYLHVPDMSAQGFAEFHRGFTQVLDSIGLIVDVRFNGGGHVSSLLLEKLARRRIGYDIQRWGQPVPYPSDSTMGPIVALTNEYAGSDGDIFSHCFKLMKLGPLVGKRTWGGVVGIWPRHELVDGSMTTQPEFSFWFTDVGFGVENYGTDPDIDVDLPPGPADAEDAQLKRTIELVLELIEQQKPAMPEFGDGPNLAPPKRLPGA